MVAVAAYKAGLAFASFPVVATALGLWDPKKGHAEI